MPMLRDLLVGLELGAEEVSGSLKLTYVRREGLGGPVPGYILAVEGFETGLLKVTEVDAGGHVPELLADSQAELACLLLGGEELIGAKQNRILNTDVLLRPHGKSRIPVACVEQGRWRYTREDFSSGAHAPASIRGRQSRSVRRSLEASATPEADQGEVWESVQGFLARMDTSSETMAMSDAYREREVDIEGLVKAFACPEDAVGVIATIDGKFAAFDLFDQPGTLRKVWPRLMTGYAADAMSTNASPHVPVTRTAGTSTLAAHADSGRRSARRYGIPADGDATSPQPGCQRSAAGSPPTNPWGTARETCWAIRRLYRRTQDQRKPLRSLRRKARRKPAGRGIVQSKPGMLSCRAASVLQPIPAYGLSAD